MAARKSEAALSAERASDPESKKQAQSRATVLGLLALALEAAAQDDFPKSSGALTPRNRGTGRVAVRQTGG
jgi:hypothetical protein